MAQAISRIETEMPSTAQAQVRTLPKGSGARTTIAISHHRSFERAARAPAGAFGPDLVRRAYLADPIPLARWVLLLKDKHRPKQYD